MDRSAIGGSRHHAIEHVELAYQMTLADAADRWVARHSADIAARKGRKRDARAPARRSRGGFHASVTSTNDEHIVHSLVLRLARSGNQKPPCFT
jgi:hypothetical protein